MAGKAIFLLFIFSLCCVKTQAFQKSDSIIIETTSPRGWIIKTKSSLYQLVLSEAGKVRQVYYGPVEQLSFRQKNSLWINGPEEIPVRGGFPDKTPILEVVFGDHVRDVELEFSNADIISIEGRKTLKMTQRDTYYPLEVTSYIRVLPEFDILEKWVEIKNTGKIEAIKIENLQSASVCLPANEYELIHMAGKWAREFQLRHTRLTAGIKTLQSRDFKSFNTPNWFTVRPVDEKADTAGSAWFGTVQYSGNWRIDFDKAFNGRLQIIGGVNFWDTKWKLKPGQSFKSPKFIIGYSGNGSEDASRKLRTYVRETILPEKWQNKPRPVLYNGWYTTGTNINAEKLLELAVVAKEIGVELFVVDDGWFKGRNNVKAGLGDWTADKNKFPNGLQPMIKKINAMGMDFGIWVEPEMVNPNSDLYRAHPDWVLYFPHRTRHEWRNQLVLNLAREDVYQYLLSALSKLLSNNNIKYIKWDHNRALTDPGWPSAPADKRREVRIRYVNNLYRLIDTLRDRFPEVLIENCSSGGGRVDLGMLSRMDQAWVSDNTDPIDRLFIQYGYLSAFPANTMVSWVTHKDHHQLHPSLDFKFDVSMSGVLGIGYDITKWTEEELQLAKDKVALYKKIRPLVQQGTLYRLISPFETNKVALEYVSDDRSSAVVFCYNMAEYMGGSIPEIQSETIRLQGLDPKASYKITSLGNKVYKGDFLMNIGISWPVGGAYKSNILELKKQ